MSDVKRLMSNVFCMMYDVWCLLSYVRRLMSHVWCEMSDVRRLMSNVSPSDIMYLMSDVDVICLILDVWC